MSRTRQHADWLATNAILAPWHEDLGPRQRAEAKAIAHAVRSVLASERGVTPDALEEDLIRAALRSGALEPEGTLYWYRITVGNAILIAGYSVWRQWATEEAILAELDTALTEAKS